MATVIAAGGASRRLGAFKPLAQLRGRPLISYALECASRTANRVYVLLNNESQAERLRGIIHSYGASIIFDRGHLPFPGSLVRSLAQVDEEILFLMGCDTPFLDSRLPELLLLRLGSSGAAVPVWPNGYTEPMMALYLKSRLPSGDAVQSMRALLLTMGASLIKIVDLGVDPESFLNINSPSDLTEAEEKPFSLEDGWTLFDLPGKGKNAQCCQRSPARNLA